MFQQISAHLWPFDFPFDYPGDVDDVRRSKMTWDRTQMSICHSPKDCEWGHSLRQDSCFLELYPHDTFPANCHGGSTEGKREIRPFLDCDGGSSHDEVKYDVYDDGDLIVKFE